MEAQVLRHIKRDKGTRDTLSGSTAKEGAQEPSLWPRSSRLQGIPPRREQAARKGMGLQLHMGVDTSHWLLEVCTALQRGTWNTEQSSSCQVSLLLFAGGLGQGTALSHVCDEQIQVPAAWGETTSPVTLRI